MLNINIDGASFAKNLLDGVEEMAGESKSSPIWTIWVKRYLVRLGLGNLQYRSIYTDGEGMSEFMLDFVGWRDGHPGGAVLACECEWGHTKNAAIMAARVTEDFDKLLSFKAPIKLMIFATDQEKETQNKIIDSINEYLTDYQDHRAGEHYLVVDMSSNRSAWECVIGQDTQPARTLVKLSRN